MFFRLTTLLRARPLAGFAGKSSRVLRLANGSSASPSTLIPSNRSFSGSQYHQVEDKNEKATSFAALHNHPFLAVAKTTRNDSGVEVGTEFNHFKVPPHLVPRGWTNDPHHLELCVGSNLHKDYIDFPKACTPILASSGQWGYLIEAGGKFYVSTYKNELFRLNTSIELAQLLEHMREQAGGSAEKAGDVRFEPKLLEHSALDWFALGQAEWTEKKKCDVQSKKERDDRFHRGERDRGMLKSTRKEYVEWMVLRMEHRVEGGGWKIVQEVLRLGDQEKYRRAVGERTKETAFMEYRKFWEAVERVRAGEEYDKALADAKTS